MLGHLLLVVLIIIQSRGKCLKGSAFLHVVIMGIDLLRGKKVGMAEPFRNVFHRNSLVAEKSRTAMTEIMESDMGHIVIIKKSFETCRNPVRSYQIPVFEDIDVVIEFVVVSVSEEKFHLLLALLHLEKHIDRCVTERKGTERALVLGRVLEEELILLTIGSLYDRMFDRNRLILEVEQEHHLLVDGTLKSDESGVNTLFDFSRKTRTKGSRDISVIYAFNLEKKEPVCF